MGSSVSNPPVTSIHNHNQAWTKVDGARHREDGPASYKNHFPRHQRWPAVLQWCVKDHLFRAVWMDEDLEARLAESTLSQRYYTKGADA